MSDLMLTLGVILLAAAGVVWFLWPHLWGYEDEPPESVKDWLERHREDDGSDR